MKGNLTHPFENVHALSMQIGIVHHRVSMLPFSTLSYRKKSHLARYWGCHVGLIDLVDVDCCCDFCVMWIHARLYSPPNIAI